MLVHDLGLHGLKTDCRRSTRRFSCAYVRPRLCVYTSAGGKKTGGPCNGACCPAGDSCDYDTFTGNYGCCAEGTVRCNGVCCKPGGACDFNGQCTKTCEPFRCGVYLMEAHMFSRCRSTRVHQVSRQPWLRKSLPSLAGKHDSGTRISHSCAQSRLRAFWVVACAPALHALELRL